MFWGRGLIRGGEYRVEEAEKAWERLTGNPVSDVGGMGDEEREAKMVMRYAGGCGVLTDEYRLLVGIGMKRT